LETTSIADRGIFALSNALLSPFPLSNCPLEGINEHGTLLSFWEMLRSAYELRVSGVKAAM